MTNHQDLLTAQELAGLLHLSVETIWRYTRENRIPYIELGSRQYRYRIDDVVKALSCNLIQEQSAHYQASGKLSYQDYLEMPEEPGYRLEILDGMLVKEPSPNVIHQRVSRNLYKILDHYFAQTEPEGEVFFAPLDVTMHEYNVVQPDLFYVTGAQESLIKDARIDGSPTLIVEIQSPSSGRKDRLQKMRIYQEEKVQHYWLVNPAEKTLECFALHEGVYALVASGMEEEIVLHPEFSGLSIPLKNLWSKSRVNE